MKNSKRISDTAYMTALLRQEKIDRFLIDELMPKIPFGIRLFYWLKKYIFSRRAMRKMACVVAERYRAIDTVLLNLIAKHRNRVVVLEVGCGFSPRAINFARNHVPFYCESDASRGIVNEKKRLVSKVVQKYCGGIMPVAYHITELDVLTRKLTQVLRLFDNAYRKKHAIIVISEGLLGYFNEETERDAFLSQIAEFQRQGRWRRQPLYFICPVSFRLRPAHKFSFFAFAHAKQYDTSSFLPNWPATEQYFRKRGFKKVSIKNFGTINVVVAEK